MIINNLYALFTINYERERLALEMVQRRQLRKKVHIFKEILKVLRINERLSQNYPIQIQMESIKSYLVSFGPRFKCSVTFAIQLRVRVANQRAIEPNLSSLEMKKESPK